MGRPKKPPWVRKTETLHVKVREITKERWYEALEHAKKMGIVEDADGFLGYLLTLYWRYRSKRS